MLSSGHRRVLLRVRRLLHLQLRSRVRHRHFDRRSYLLQKSHLGFACIMQKSCRIDVFLSSFSVLGVNFAVFVMKLQE